MKRVDSEIRVIWLNVNGCYAVTFGDQLLPIGGQTLFAYKWQLEDALEVCELECRDFEGDGRIYTKCVPYTPRSRK